MILLLWKDINALPAQITAASNGRNSIADTESTLQHDMTGVSSTGSDKRNMLSIDSKTNNIDRKKQKNKRKKKDKGSTANLLENTDTNTERELQQQKHKKRKIPHRKLSSARLRQKITVDRVYMLKAFFLSLIDPTVGGKIEHSGSNNQTFSGKDGSPFAVFADSGSAVASPPPAAPAAAGGSFGPVCGPNGCF